MPSGAGPATPAAGRGARPGWPFQHARLALYFALLAVLGSLVGIWQLRRLGPDPDPIHAQWILASCVAAVCVVGLAGVIVHRLRVLPLRFQETERYLKAIGRESQKYRMLMEGAADMLVLVDPRTGRLREWNARARTTLGLLPSAERTPELAELVVPEDLERLRAALEQAAAASGQVTPLGELRLRAAGGPALTADARLASIALEDESVVLLALRDVTRQKQIEQELAVRERLSSIGLMTAGVAHEINNPLEGIANYLRLAENPDLTPALRAEHLDAVRHGFERVRDLVRDLLRFARPQPGEGLADLAQIVQRAARLTTYSSGMGQLEIETAGLEQPIEVVGDAGRLEQVLFNLLINAGIAMQGQGRVRVVARRTDDPTAGATVELEVADQGPGIPPGDLERVFDPFFTTRESTGLGLSVSYGIVHAHGGELRAGNAPEGGAVFTIRLPLRGAR